MTLRDALDRTLRLMRDELDESVGDAALLDVLTGTRIALIADVANIASHSAQTAFVTAAILMARSGHHVYFLAPDVPLVGTQPPMKSGHMVEQLIRIGTDMLPDVTFSTKPPADEIDLALALGNSPITVRARRRIRLNAEPWVGRIAREDDSSPWSANWWPLGAMAAAALGATEAFKVAIRKLQHFARNPGRMDTVFADTDELIFALAPTDAPCCRNLGQFDCVSGGAIINAALYTLARIPAVSGRARIIEPEFPDISNLNRYMLLLRSRLEIPKADDLASICYGTGLHIEPILARYEPATLNSIAPLAPSVLVGVDHIPTRWAVQKANPEWLGVGATTHWSAMASFHQAGLGCAQCLHPSDDPSTAPIPTVAFVSFWAGLLTAAYLLRRVSDELVPQTEQQIYLTPFRGENPTRSKVPIRANCPTCTDRTALTIASRQ